MKQLKKKLQRLNHQSYLIISHILVYWHIKQLFVFNYITTHYKKKTLKFKQF